ncbi:MAG: response regulator [archaeon]|nr:response regulator [archaeon]
MISVLMIEDSKLMRAFLTKILLSNGFTIAGSADTVEKGIELYKELKPELVTMDMVLKGKKSGIDGINEIIEYDSEAKILVCSALSQELLKEKVFKAGAKGFIVKPFKEKKIMAQIEKIIDFEEMLS